jgi:GNAT superfamily N-acetyltransferase
MYTAPAWRGQGVATELLKEIIAFVKGTSARRIYLHATIDGERIYEKAGFVAKTSEMELMLVASASSTAL